LPGRIAEIVAVSALATIITAVIAAPVLRAPSERVFGMEIVGRHHDPFTTMEQFARPITVGAYSQPVTDIAGAMFARISGAVAAYNWLVLLTFPLSAAAAYLLARHLALSPAGATVAALAYAFSPFHLAHAAYHPHIAQTQWIPLYLLALWRCLDDASLANVGLLGAATVVVTLSNLYAGLIAAVITPVAVATYWLASPRDTTRSVRRLAITVATLVLLTGGGALYAWYAAPAVLENRGAFAFPRADLFRYSAKWWSYLLPPVAQPLLGAAARRAWETFGIHEGLLEQQVSLGWGIVALGLIAVSQWLVRTRQPASLSRVPVLALVAAAGLLCSLSPERAIAAFTFVRPSALLYQVVPMFRAYARFGIVVQLMAALLAGVGVDYLRRRATRRAQVACVVFLAMTVGEYSVAPSALWRDVLPTTAHRWIMRQPAAIRALDCTPLGPESESVQWLTANRVALLGGSIADCTEPDLAQKLAANGYSHLLVRHPAAGNGFDGFSAPDGLHIAARFADSDVFAVTTATPAIYTATMTGFFPREHDAQRSWRWMGTDATWTAVNTGVRPLSATLQLELSAFYRARHLEFRLDGRVVATLDVAPLRRVYRIGPLLISPGDHELVFHPEDAPTPAGDVIGNRDPRALSFAVGTWNWRTGNDEQ